MRPVLGILLLLLIKTAGAQLPEYYAYLVKGKIQYKKGKAKAKAVPLSPKTLLFKEDLLIIPKGNAELTLVNGNSDYLVITQSGSYKVGDLPKQPHKEPENITRKYFTLVWEELFKPKKDFSQFKKENLVGVRGAVSRGECDVLKWPLDESICASPEISFSWKHVGSDLLYTFILLNESGKELMKLKIRDTQLIINTNPLIIGNQNKYYWTVRNNTGECQAIPQYALHIWMPAELKNKIKEIEQSVTAGEDSILYHLQVADKLEQENLFEAAYQYYQALLKNKNDLILRKAFVAFLLRNEKDEEARAVYEN